MAREPKPIPIKRTYQGPAGSPAGQANTPRQTYAGKPLKQQ